MIGCFKKFIIGFSFIGLLIVACSSSTDPDASGLGIYGTVTDVSGRPVADVGVHTFYPDLAIAGKVAFRVTNPDTVVFSGADALMANDCSTVTLFWETVFEEGSAGFHVWRSEDDEQGEYIRITTSMIPAAGNSDTSLNYDFTDSSVVVGVNYWYKIEAVYLGGDSFFFGPVVPVIIAEQQAALPLSFDLLQNFPNPFNLNTNIQFMLPERSAINIIIMDAMNQSVRTLVNQMLEAGVHRVTWDGSDDNGQQVSNGLYECQLMAGDTSISRMVCRCMGADDTNTYSDLEPLTTTDSNGRFFLDYAFVPVDEEVIWTSETGDLLGALTLSNVSVVLIREGYVPLIRALDISMSKNANLSFTLTTE